MLNERHLFLVGFMGSGKSTVGALLAARLKRPFIDLDARIARRAGTSIREVFEQRGEAAFRRMESAALRDCRLEEPSVIALGGGAFSTAENRGTAGEQGISIWLNVSLVVADRRCRGARNRPLADDRQQFEALYGRRQRHYRESDLEVDADKTPRQTCLRILEALLDRESR